MHANPLPGFIIQSNPFHLDHHLIFHPLNNHTNIYIPVESRNAIAFLYILDIDQWFWMLVIVPQPDAQLFKFENYDVC